MTDVTGPASQDKIAPTTNRIAEVPMPVYKLSPKLTVAPQIVETDPARLKAEGFGLILNNRPDGEEPGQWTAAAAREAATKAGLAYVHQPVTSPTIDAAAVAAFAKTVAESPAPVYAHCRSGTRCYVLWAAGEALAGRADAATLAAEGASRGFDLSGLPALVARLQGG